MIDFSGYEGKAGMVCITGDDKKHDLRRLNEEMKHSLPSYAKPLFIRFVAKVEETGKHCVVDIPVRKRSDSKMSFGNFDFCAFNHRL